MVVVGGREGERFWAGKGAEGNGDRWRRIEETVVVFGEGFGAGG